MIAAIILLSLLCSVGEVFGNDSESLILFQSCGGWSRNSQKLKQLGTSHLGTSHPLPFLYKLVWSSWQHSDVSSTRLLRQKLFFLEWTAQESKVEVHGIFVTSVCKSYSISCTLIYGSKHTKASPGSEGGDRPHLCQRGLSKSNCQNVWNGRHCRGHLWNIQSARPSLLSEEIHNKKNWI